MDSVANVSLTFIKNIDEEVKMTTELIASFQSITKPGDFLQNLPDYTNTINSLDSKITISKNNIAYLVSAYRMRMNRIRELLGKYREELSDQLDKNDQVTSTDTFYNEENLLSKHYYCDYENDPSMYSMMAIVKRILHNEADNVESLDNTTSDLSTLYKWFIDAQSFILNVKCILTEKSFMDKFMTDYMCAEAEKEIQSLLRYFIFIKERLSSSKAYVTKIFQQMNASENDYKIYDMVVNKFVSVANESYFSAGTVVSGII